VTNERSEWQGQWLYVSLDGEMTGIDLTSGAALISVGAATWENKPGESIHTYYSMMNPGEMTWSPEAAAVHGLSQQEVKQSKSASEVDDELSQWLTNLGASRGQVIPVGVNFASFDGPFFKKYLPKTSALLSHRTVDINSLCFTWACATGKSFSEVKTQMYAMANNLLDESGIPVREHDAGFDAAQALTVWHAFVQNITGDNI